MSKIALSPRFPNDIRRIRRSRHLRLKDVAILMGQKSVAHISHWEKGRKIPSLTNLFKLAAILGIQPEFLFLELYRQIRKDVHELNQNHNIFERYD
ncbi:MAG: helix-turn-helix transcriptional regulator [Patescibacteria group bacterium]|jgi:transcriptional regulator with XRE-family HTH domain